jgi:hypothetical protein
MPAIPDWRNHDLFLEAIDYDPRILRVDGKKYRIVLSDIPARIAADI